MKSTYYFPHDYHARHDPKLERLFLTMGYEGIGIYWCLIERLYEQEGSLKIQDIKLYANGNKDICDRITSVVNDFDLFKNDGDRFWSESCCKRLEAIIDKREKAAQSAKKRWDNADAMPLQCDGNAIKERKGKEINKRSLDFSYLEPNNIKNLIKSLGDKHAVKRHLESLGFYEYRIIEAFEKAEVIKNT